MNSDLSDLRPLETPIDPMEFLSRLWSSSALHLYEETLADDIAGEHDSAASPCPTTVSDNPFSFASSSTSQLVLDRLMSYIQAVPGQQRPSSGGKMVGKWLKDRRETKKEEARTHNTQLHAAVSLAGVSSAVAAVAIATAKESGRKECSTRTDIALASAAMLVAAQCVEAAKDMGADHEQLVAVIGSAVSVRNSDDIATLTAAAATALRAAATLKDRTLREVWNIAAVIPIEKGGMSSQLDNHLDHQNKLNSPATSDGNDSIDTGLNYEENFLGICSQEVLGRGAELLKRTRKGDLHWKIVSVYINKMGQVILKMKSKHIVGTITKNKKSMVIEVCKEVPEWSSRNLLEEEQRRYFGLKVTEGRIIEFECRTEREHEIWTEGITHLLDISREGRSRRTSLNK